MRGPRSPPDPRTRRPSFTAVVKVEVVVRMSGALFEMRKLVKVTDATAAP